MSIKYVVTPFKIGAVLGLISIYLAAQSLFNEYLIENVFSSDTHPTTVLLLDLFSVNLEESIPTWYSTLLLFMAALLLAAITKAKWLVGDRFRYYWAGLTLIFLYLSVDEGAAIHEIVVDPLQSLFHPTGYFAFAWQIVAVPLVILFVWLYIPFIFHLPVRWRYLFILSGAVYVTGTLVVEAISANRWDLDHGISFAYLAIATVEELFEMVGVVLFIYTLLSYMAANSYTYSVTFTPLAGAENTATQVLSHISNPNVPAINWKWVISPLFCFILAMNGLLFFWARSLPPDRALSPSEPVPFYRQIIEHYAGEGVVVLRLNGTFTPDNPATEQLATSLLVLFDEVIVVSLPQDNLSIAFAGSGLPFDRNDLDHLLRASGNQDFSILDTQAIKALAQK